MGDVLIELEKTLRSKQEGLTRQEWTILMACKANSIVDFTVGAAKGGGVAWLASWLATRRLSNLSRITLSAGVAAVSGLWKFGRSFDDCVGYILDQDGTRMQKELADIMVNRYRDDPMAVWHISRNFYVEKVFDDSSTDQPRLRWRYRNFFFADAVARSPWTNDDVLNSHSPDSEKNDKEGSDEPKRVSSIACVDAIMDPFDCVFGSSEEIYHSITSSPAPKRHGRRQKRSRRRHRMHYHEVPSNLALS